MPPTAAARVLVASLLCLLSVACDIQELAPSVEPDAKPAPVPAPSPQQLERFRSLMAKASETGSAKVVSGLIDYAGLVERAAVGLEIRSTVTILEDVREGAERSGVPYLWANASERGMSLTFQRTEQDQAGTWARYRAVYAEGGFDLFYFLLRPEAESARIVDWRQLTAGENVVATLRDQLLLAQANLLGALRASLDPQRRALVVHAEAVKRFQQLATESPEAAVKAYQALPEAVQQARVLQMQYVYLTQLVSQDLYTQTMADFIARFPEDPAAQVMALDFHASKGDLEGAVKAAVRLDTMVGGEPYLASLRAPMLVQLGRKDEAVRALNEAMARDDELVELRIASLNVGATTGDYALAAQAAQWLLERKLTDVDTLKAQPDLASFVGSEAFAQLQQKRAEVQQTQMPSAAHAAE